MIPWPIHIFSKHFSFDLVKVNWKHQFIANNNTSFLNLKLFKFLRQNVSQKYYSKGKKRIQQHLFQYCAIWAAHLNWFYFSIRLLLLKSSFLSIKTFIDKVFLCDKSPNPNFTNELKSHLCLHDIIFFIQSKIKI